MSSKLSSTDVVEVKNIDERRGRGVVARATIAAGAPIFAVVPDEVVLYSPFAGSRCAHCFTACLAAASARCPTCDQFILCATCALELSGDAASTRGDHPKLRAHELACAWYNELPPAVRAPGMDTDYLRFCLAYGARVSQGDAAYRAGLAQLASNASLQSDEVVAFCTTFARDRVVRTFSGYPAGSDASSRAAPRFSVPWEELRDTLLRVRCNALGFPFTAAETLGWTMDALVCLLNHSCEPNAAVVVAAEDEAFRSRGGPLAGRLGIKALRAIAPGEEITFSYLDLVDCGMDVMARTRLLMDHYCFFCQCGRCCAQRRELMTAKRKGGN